MKCWNCSFENPPGAKFCQNCGQALTLTCPQCGHANQPSARFCSNCGSTLAGAGGASSPGAVKRAEGPLTEDPRVQRYMPKEIADKLEAARANKSLEGERRIVTILFCDVKGSTAIAEKMDPEEWAEIMNAGFSFLIEPVYKYEGTVARLMGDAILAFFGAPIAHEDDPKRAILAALEIVQGVSGYCAQIRRKHGIDYQVRVGLNTGLVVVGNIGTDLKYEYTAMGDAINLASRLQTAAEPNSVFISESTHRLAEPLFEFEDKGEVEVKGKSQPIHVYRVLGERPGHIETRGIAGLSSPLVGRRRELLTLNQITSELRAGRGSIVSIIGEAGLGKSRLVAEWRKLALAEDGEPPLHWVEGRCLSYSTSVAHHLNSAILRELIGAPQGTSDEITRNALRKLTEQLLQNEAELVYPYLGHLLGLPLEETAEERVRALSGPALVARYVTAYKRLLQALAQAAPLVIICEDTHWADPSSVELGLQLLPLVVDTPIVFAFIMRPEKQAPAWKFVTQSHDIAGAGATELYLAPLSESDSRELVGNLLQIETLPEQLQELIRTKAEGNPFFVEEVIRMLIERGAIARENNHWQVTRTIQTFEIPDTLQGVLLARIDRLPEGAKRTLQVASVIGRRFQERVLQQILGAEQRPVLADQLGVLESSGLIRLSQQKPDAEYMARHALIQDAAYNSLLKQDRKQLHQAVGAALEQLYPDRLDEYAPILEQHYAEADNVAKMCDYAIRAGDAAARLYAHAEARFHYANALNALLDLADNGDNRRRRVDTTVKLVSVSALSASPEKNLQRLSEVEPIAAELAGGGSVEDKLRLARVHYWMGRSHYYQGESREALGYYQKVLAEAQGLGDDNLLAIPMSNLGQVMAMVQGLYGKAEPLLTRAIPLLEKSDDTTEWLRAFTYAALARTARGEYAEGVAQIKQALQRAEETGDLTGVGFTQLALTNAYTRVNDIPALLAAAKAAVQAAEKSGNVLHAYIAYGALGWALGLLGDFEGARANFARSDQLGEKLGPRLVIADQLAAGKAVVALCAGNLDETLSLAERAVGLAKRVGSVYSEGLAQRVWGEALASSAPPRCDDAPLHFSASVTALNAAGDFLSAANTYAAWGKWDRSCGNLAAAREHLGLAAAQYEKSGLTELLGGVRALLGELEPSPPT